MEQRGAGGAVIQLTGNRQALIDGCDGIVDYSPERVVLRARAAHRAPAGPGPAPAGAHQRHRGGRGLPHRDGIRFLGGSAVL